MYLVSPLCLFQGMKFTHHSELDHSKHTAVIYTPWATLNISFVG